MKDTEMLYRDGVLYITTTPANTHIENSYLVKSRKDMRRILGAINENSSCGDAIRRIPVATMIREWRAHNLLYALGIAKNRTRDVDLNENKWYLRVAYVMLSCLYWRL